MCVFWNPLLHQIIFFLIQSGMKTNQIWPNYPRSSFQDFFGLDQNLVLGEGVDQCLLE